MPLKTTAQSSLNSRYVIRAEAEPLKVRSGMERIKGLFLITEDGLGVAQFLADLLIYQGAFAYVIETKNCLQEEDIKKEITLAKDLFGPVKGIIHMAGLRAMNMPKTIKSWHEEVQLQCKSFFHLLKFCGQDLADSSFPGFKRLVSCSLLGGHYGRDCALQPGLPTAGAGQGLLRSLEYEWDYILAKTIDFDLTLSAHEMATIIINEICAGGGKLEIGYPKGERTIFSTRKIPLVTNMKPAGLIPQKKQVILSTGGARGITAETIRLLSSENNQYILVGRSELLRKNEYTKYRSKDKSQLRIEFIAETKKSSERTSPRAIEARIAKILGDREIRQNIALLRRSGSKVKYIPCDVTDPVAFGALIDSIYEEYGTIDLVVHGAGVIDDYLLADKTSASFNKVFDTKVDSTFILYNKLRWDKLKAFLLFSSTAGRYGNRGQSDYAAANEVLNRMAWGIKAQSPDVLVKSFNWGPWSDIGMATGVVNEQFISRGIIPISPQSGTSHFIGELMHGEPNEVEVVIGEGTWDPDRQNKIQDIFNFAIDI